MMIPIIVVIYLFADWYGIVGPQKIKGLPEIRGYPIVGVLYNVISNPSQKYMEWAKTHGEVFQMRMGNRMVVVANSYDSVRELWWKNRDANNSRPILFTFHSVVSKTQGFTIGTTPFGESYKKKKLIISKSLNKANVEALGGLIDRESRGVLRRIHEHSFNPQLRREGQSVNLFKYIQGFVLRVSLFVTYGYSVKVEHGDKCRLFDEITYVENGIVKLRGHSSNTQDYVPILRYLPFRNKTNIANDLRVRRDVYMTKFIDNVKSNMGHDSNYRDSIVGQVLGNSDRYPVVNDDELKSVCLTMVSAGLDNTPLVLYHILGHLSQPSYGKALQDLALSEILKVHGSLKRAFDDCVDGFKVSFVEALIKEGLRYFSVLPTSLPRATTKDIIYRNSVIPAGTILFMNAFSANHDHAHFENPYCFLPNRFLTNDFELKKTYTETTMLSFGAGSRMCAGMNLAMKEMYVLLLRTLILYEIEPPAQSKYLMELDPFKLNAVPDSVAIEPSDYRVSLKIRDPIVFEIFSQSLER